MRALSPALQSYLATRQGVVTRSLVWVRATNRSTGAEETLGLWNGEDDRVITIGGQARTYLRTEALTVGQIVSQAGLAVRMHRLQLSSLSAPVAQLLRGYDARNAPIEIHRAFFATTSMAMLEEPERRFKGTIDEAPIPTPEAGGEASADIVCASATRVLTRTLAQKKSRATQVLRSGDEFRRYADLSGKIPVGWGEIVGGIDNSAAGAKTRPSGGGGLGGFRSGDD